ncbi:hypothetical protein BD311DRAFT_765476 [Dichomitus squalens]|uniref:Uncharacterized protein n=1 Tax=Dichomitus squalens TaxID=114155 RepID=A0A4Q9MCI4_9APHY|nr:hypothetical protein BD311DRAFT_765476 [Dichomitus squalens]
MKVLRGSRGVLGLPASQLEYVIVCCQVRAAGGKTDNTARGTATISVFAVFESATSRLKMHVLHDIPFLPSNDFGLLAHSSCRSSSIGWTSRLVAAPLAVVELLVRLRSH